MHGRLLLYHSLFTEFGYMELAYRSTKQERLPYTFRWHLTEEENAKNNKNPNLMQTQGTET